MQSYYIELFNSSDKDKGYNRCKFSNDTTGIIFSDETKEKMRQSKLGTSHSEETKEKMRQARLGKLLSDETKEKK